MAVQTVEAQYGTCAIGEVPMIHQSPSFPPQIPSVSRDARESRFLIGILAMAGAIIGAVALGAAVGDYFADKASWAPFAAGIVSGLAASIAIRFARRRSQS
jgi:hypothetical protein